MGGGVGGSGPRRANPPLECARCWRILAGQILASDGQVPPTVLFAGWDGRPGTIIHEKGEGPTADSLLRLLSPDTEPTKALSLAAHLPRPRPFQKQRLLL